MQLLNLTIHNLGVFRGTHHFDFAPLSKADGTLRHLTVVSGQNGVGKTTLFQSLPLALYGSLALGDRVSRQAYNSYLYNRLHRYEGTGVQLVSDQGGLELTFNYVQSGRLLKIHLERVWKRNDAIVQESLKISVDGCPLDVPPEDFQVWINDLIPPGLTNVCFFDAEKLDALADPLRQEALLEDAINKLLGLHLVEQLDADIDRYMITGGKGYKTLEVPRTEVIQHQAAIDSYDEHLSKLQEELKELAETEKSHQAALAKKERELISKGGNYASRRLALQERLITVCKQKETVEIQLREICAELLPFSFAPKLCHNLSQRLSHEAERRIQQTAEVVWKKRVTDLKKFLGDSEFWKGTKVSQNDKEVIVKRLVDKVRGMSTSSSKSKKSFVHQLSDAEQQELQNLITSALFAVPQTVQVLCESLKELQAEQSQITKDLSRAPDDESLALIHTDIVRLQESVDSVRQQLAELNNQIGAIRFQREEQARGLQRAVELLHKAQANERKFVLAVRSKLVLAAYKDALLRQRLSTLEGALTKSFNAICRKDFLLRDVTIQPESFTIQLQGMDGNNVSLSDFSAGERQLYALALLQGLRQASGRHLPLAIDTPLARLDEVHRRRLIQTYIPSVSDQVIIFTTDMELDAQLLSKTEPYLARIYQLKFDQSRKESLAIKKDPLFMPVASHEVFTGEREAAHVS